MFLEFILIIILTLLFLSLIILKKFVLSLYSVFFLCVLRDEILTRSAGS